MNFFSSDNSNFTNVLVSERKNSVKKILSNQGGEKFRRDLYAVGVELVDLLLKKVSSQTEFFLVAIPRGGIPIGVGVRDRIVHYGRSCHYLLSNYGEKKTANKEIISQPLIRSGSLIIVDGIIGSGKTIGDHLSCLKGFFLKNNLENVFVVAGVASDKGLRNVAKTFFNLGVSTSLSFFLGKVIPKRYCSWVTIANKKIYRVGLDGEIGDYGDMVQQGLTYSQLKKWFPRPLERK